MTVYFEVENVESTRADSNYLLKTYAAIAQCEVEELSSIIEWGHEKQFIKGVPLLGNLYGYKRMKKDGDKIIQIIEKEATIIREIFQMYLEGKSYTEISNILTERRVKTKFGRDLWTSVGVKSILTNISYTGNYIARRRKRDLFTNRYYDSSGLRDQYYIKNSHPAIVDLEVFLAVQKQIENQGTRKFKQYERKNTVLTGRVVCGNCGRNYCVIDRPPKPRRQCQTNKKNHIICPSPILREHQIKEMFLTGMEKRFDLKKRSDIQKMLRLIRRFNDNDNFEFHRLKAITYIDMAKKMEGTQFTANEIKELERKYKEFEEKIIKIEDDRPYRLEALEWLKDVQTVDEFRKQSTLEHLRAWILEIVVYSEDDYLFRWIDGEETEIGKCYPAEKIYSEEEIKKGHKVAIAYQVPEKSQTYEEENEKEQFIQLKENGLHLKKYAGKEDENLEVVKIMPTKSSMLLEKVQNSINKYGPIDMNLPVDPNKKIRVAAYIRVSTDSEEQLNSFKTQLAFYSFYIISQPNYEFVGIYADEGLSGTSTKNRKEFNRMIEDCKSGKIDLIITKSISRFARNTVDILYYTRMLATLKPPVYIKFEKENILTKDLRSQALLTILGSLSQEESINLGKSVAWSKKNLAGRGIIKPAMLGYGYKYGKNSEWIIVEEEARVVRRIYKEFLQGKSERKIAHDLTTEGIKTPEGKKNWSFDTIKEILNSERYNGDYLFQRFYSTLTVEKKIKKNHGEKPMFLVEDHHQPIIEQDLWEQVQERIMIRKNKSKKNEKPPSLKDNGKNEVFNKRLKCGKCGATISYAKAGSKPYVYKKWRCMDGFRGYCTVGGFSQEYLEQNFSQFLMDMKFNPLFQAAINNLIETLSLSESEKEERENIKIKINELSHQLHQVVKEGLGKKGKNTKKVDELTNRVLELRKLIIDFDKREEQLGMVVHHLQVLETNLKNYTDPTKDDYGFYLNIPEFLDTVYKTFIKEGILHEDGKVTYSLHLGLEWSAPNNYVNFKQRIKDYEHRRKIEEKERYLNGPEVKALIKFCRTPKSIHEMHQFFKNYKHAPSMKKSIVDPLIEKGIIKRTIPDKPSSNNQRYYSVKVD